MGPCEFEIIAYPEIDHGFAKVINDLGNDPFVFTVLHIASSTDAIQHMLKLLFDLIEGARGESTREHETGGLDNQLEQIHSLYRCSFFHGIPTPEFNPTQTRNKTFGLFYRYPRFLP